MARYRLLPDNGAIRQNFKQIIVALHAPPFQAGMTRMPRQGHRLQSNIEQQQDRWSARASRRRAGNSSQVLDGVLREPAAKPVPCKNRITPRLFSVVPTSVRTST